VPSGIIKAKVRASAKVPGRTSVVVVAKPLTIATPAAATPPAVATVVLDPPYAASGQCAASAFAQCTFSKSGAAFRCR
jgi:hypothetical protein